MAKLYFRYGAMGSSKSANILMVRYNYEERGQYAVLLKPRTDNRDGEHEIKSRIGLEAPAEYVDEFLKEISETWSADSGNTGITERKWMRFLSTRRSFFLRRKLIRFRTSWIFMGFRFSATVCVRTSRHICFRVRED